MRRIDNVLTEIRHRCETRAARLQGLVEPAADFDRTEECLALYRLIKELREISRPEAGPERILNLERLTRMRMNFHEQGTGRIINPKLMEDRIEDTFQHLTGYPEGRFANSTYLMSMRSAVRDATTYACICELIEHAFDLLDEWDSKRPVPPQRIKSIKARNTPESTKPAGEPPIEAPAETPRNMAPKSTIQIDSGILDRYVGTYEYSPDRKLMFFRNGTQLIAQVAGHNPVPLHARNGTEFYSQISKFKFQIAGDVPAAWVILHRDGKDKILNRAGCPESRDTDGRFTQWGYRKALVRESEAALRRILAGVENRKVDYRQIAPSIAQVTREEIARYRRDQLKLGALLSLQFLRVDAQDSDVFAVVYQHGSLDWEIRMDAGKIIHALRPVVGSLQLNAPDAAPRQ